MNGFIRHALTGFLILWLAASVLLFVLGLGFAGSFGAMITPPEGEPRHEWALSWLFIGMPWLLLAALAVLGRKKAL